MKLTMQDLEVYKRLIHKILPLFEESNEGLTTYIGYVHSRIYGLQYSIGEENRDLILELFDILEYLYDESIAPDPDMETVRKRVLNCQSSIDKKFKVSD